MDFSARLAELELLPASGRQVYSPDKVRSALFALAVTMPDLTRAFGAKGEVDPVRYQRY